MDVPNNPDRGSSITPAPTPPIVPDTDPAPDTAPLTPRQWLAQNGPMLLIILFAIAWVYTKFGFAGLISAALAALGLSFVVFIHELGHFVAAKMCDVHVTTFSIGFGPALPGCQFTRGETTYKIGILPLGGLVAMVGEGPEADEEESYPRSFKNKTVFQRMFIISAGVIMNVIFGMLCFIAVYYNHGVDRPPAIVWRTEAGSRSWELGVRAGWKVSRIDSVQNPYFDDLKYAVANSGSSAALEFEFTDRDGKKHVKSIEPLRDQNSMMPTIGVAYPSRLKLYPEQAKRLRSMPVAYSSAAAHARVMPLDRGDEVLTVDGDPLTGGFAELCHRMHTTDAPLTLTVKRVVGGEEKVEVPVGGLDWGDTIIGMTDPSTPDEPFHVTPLPPDPFGDPKRPMADPFEYRRRLYALAGKPLVLQVSRGKEGTHKVLVPPAYHRDFGMRMKMGKVAAIREESGAARTKLARGDEIKAVGWKLKGQDRITWLKDFDPVRLPDTLNEIVHRGPAAPEEYEIVFKVKATVNHDKEGERQLEPIAWDDSYGPGDEAPISTASPMSIPQLGVAYLVESTVVAVRPGSPADKAGIKAKDEIVQLRVRVGGKTPDVVAWDAWQTMASRRGKQAEVYDQWAYYHAALHRGDFPIIEVRVKRGGELLPGPGESGGWLSWLGGKPQAQQAFGPIAAVEDESWPAADRGLLLMLDTRREKAESLLMAAQLGLERSLGFIKNIYLNLRGLIIGRISPSGLGGPIEIASQAFSFANEDWFVFFQFLGIISINLAVVNFLPIPVLDGGHMVFLLYEWARGKPASETVRVAATYLGLALILSLMVFVFIIDGRRNNWW